MVLLYLNHPTCRMLSMIISHIGPKLANDIPLSNNDDHCHREYVKGINNRFEFHPADSGQVLKLLNKLNKSRGAGLNKLSSRLIRECADLISPYLNYFKLLFNYRHIP